MTDFDLGGFGGAAHHGTEKKYRQGCRCAECRSAQSDAGKRRRAQKKVEWPAVVPHGTTTGYNYYGCRCDECKFAISEYKRIAREEKVAFRETLARLREGGAS